MAPIEKTRRMHQPIQNLFVKRDQLLGKLSNKESTLLTLATAFLKISKMTANKTKRFWITESTNLQTIIDCLQDEKTPWVVLKDAEREYTRRRFEQGASLQEIEEEVLHFQSMVE